VLLIASAEFGLKGALFYCQPSCRRLENITDWLFEGLYFIICLFTYLFIYLFIIMYKIITSNMI